MAIKTEKDYIDELLGLYPVMSRKEMERVVAASTKILVKYLRQNNRKHPAGVMVSGKSVLLQGKMAKITFTPAHSKKSFLIKRGGMRKNYREKEELKKIENESKNKQ